MDFKKEELVKSPLNYTGGKFKLLPQMLPYFPNDINTFVDLFGGGCNVGANVKANRIIFNDIESHVVELLKYFKNNKIDFILDEIYALIEKYGLTRTDLYGYEYYGCNSSDGVAKVNKEGYMKLRADYNKFKTPILFYVTIVFAFSNQIKFNSKGEFNIAVNKRDFNSSMKNNLIKFVDRLNKLNIYFTDKDFKELKINKLNKNDLVYCDPPYLITCATYNDGWNETNERELLTLLDSLDRNNIKFALSNVLENKGESNEILKEWSKKYNVIHLNNSYGNCSYHAKDKNMNTTDEVLIVNYKVE